MKKISKKFLAALAACALAACVALPAAFAEDDAEEALKGINDAGATKVEVSVEPNKDVKVKEIAAKGEKTKLTAGVPEEDADLVASWQWQILADAQNEIWVNISGETGKKAELTYGMVRNLLNENDQAKVRAQAFDAEGEVIGTSSAVLVSIADEEATEEEQAEQPAMASYAMRSSSAKAVDAAVDDADNKCSIVVNYVFADGSPAAPSWTATVAKGSAYTNKVTSPSVLGYAPDQESVTVGNGADAIESDLVYTVVYQPTEVMYVVRHYQQNLDDDGYTEVVGDRQQMLGYTDSPVGTGLAKKYDGFYSLLYDPTVTIAADGSTTVNIYYDRNYYYMGFDLAGGYGVSPVYTRYGADLGTFSDPTRAGYTFLGWQDVYSGSEKLISSDELPKTMPAKNSYYKAVWQGEDVVFDVVFWYENADDEGYSQAGALYDKVAKAGSTVNGSSFKDENFEGRIDEHFTYSHADTDVEIKGDGSTVVNVYFSRNEYTLTFVNMPTSGCSAETHQHSSSCYEYVCVLDEHSHATSGCELVCAHTEHTLDCYSTRDGFTNISKPTQTLISMGNGIYTYKTYSSTAYCLNLGDEWYQSSDGRTRQITFNCSHSHGDSCYSCGRQEHAHSTDYNGGCYTLVCEKDEHYHDGGKCYLTITAKYDSDITHVWKEDPVRNALDESYVFQSSVTDDYYSFLEKMPAQNITMTATSWGGYKYTWYYYLEVLPGQDTTGLETMTNGGKTYYRYNTTTVYGSDRLKLTYDEDYYPITGFTQRDNTVPSFSNRTAYLYYLRNSYDLKFSNGGEIVSGKGGNFLYEADISGQYFVPEYPDGLEPGAYEFDGWYTSPFFGDTKFDFDGAKMPAKNITLYARWSPVPHEVNVYLTKDMSTKLCETQIIEHRGLAVEPQGVENGNYDFVGWFYMDNGQERAFDFSMPVTMSMDLYGKWISNTLMDYTIKYAVKNADGSLTYIADDTEGSALAGTTKTFEAKVGDDLYKDYREGYFPETSSHTLEIDIDDPDKNVFTFIYVPKTKLPYTVRYLEIGTEKVLLEEKKLETSDAVVTENFEPIASYMPDAYQKRLVLSATESENVITFWYAEDSVHAPVLVTHYIQNIEGDGYTEYSETTDLNGVIDGTYSVDTLQIPGFLYDHATKKDSIGGDPTPVDAVNGRVSATVSKDGLHIELYYDRLLYPYEFRFLEQGSNKVLAMPVDGIDKGIARYQAQVYGSAKDIPGYECVSPAQQAISIQIEDQHGVGATAQNNVKVFYYRELNVEYEYVIVPPEGASQCGTLSGYGETVAAKTGTANGSTATALDGYRFVGWYLDKECTIEANGQGAVVEGSSLTPVKTGADQLYTGGTFYAKFEYDTSSLSIVKEAAQGTTFRDGETFMFEIEGVERTRTEGFKMTVVIDPRVSDKVIVNDLLIGQYVVTEVTDWSRAYTPDGNAKEVTLSVKASENVVEFVNDRTDDHWLDGHAIAKNLFNE